MSRTYQAKDPARLGVVAQVLLGMQVLMCLFAAVGAEVEAQALSTLDPRAQVDVWSFSTGSVGQDLVIGLSESLQFVVYVIAGVATLRWVYRTNKNAHVLAEGLKVSPGWAVGWFFVPIAFLWKPFQGVSETWRASSTPAAWSAAPVPSLLRWWWGFWLAGNLAGNISFRIGANAHTPPVLETSDQLSAAYFLLLAITTALLMIIVRRLSSMQSRALEQRAFA